MRVGCMLYRPLTPPLSSTTPRRGSCGRRRRRPLKGEIIVYLLATSTLIGHLSFAIRAYIVLHNFSHIYMYTFYIVYYSAISIIEPLQIQNGAGNTGSATASAAARGTGAGAGGTSGSRRRPL